MKKVAFLALALAIIGCDSDVTSSGDGSGGNGGDTSGSQVGGSNAGGGNTGGNGAGGNTGGGGNGGGGAGTVCGGLGGGECAADEWCDYDIDNCGAFDNTGICRKRPDQGCPEILNPSCACDGMIYDNPCEAESAGQDLNATGICTPPADMFQCGAHFCDLASSYCERMVSDVAGIPDTFACRAIPAACNVNPDCACLANEPCTDQCEGDAATGLTLTCFGG